MVIALDKSVVSGYLNRLTSRLFLKLLDIVNQLFPGFSHLLKIVERSRHHQSGFRPSWVYPTRSDAYMWTYLTE